MLNQRQEAILLSLKKLDYLNRDQLQRMHRLGKVRNANRVLSDLAPYLSSHRESYSTIYYLNAEGREYVNSAKVRRKNSFVNHVIMRNDFYLFAGQPAEWRNEIKVQDGETTVICDAMFKHGKRHALLEVDSTQRMKENRAKIERYKALQERGIVAHKLGYFPELIWLTTTEYRRKQLTDLCEGLTAKVYTIDDIK